MAIGDAGEWQAAIEERAVELAVDMGWAADEACLRCVREYVATCDDLDQANMLGAVDYALARFARFDNESSQTSKGNAS